MNKCYHGNNIMHHQERREAEVCEKEREHAEAWQWQVRECGQRPAARSVRAAASGRCKITLYHHPHLHYSPIMPQSLMAVGYAPRAVVQCVRAW